MKKLGESNDSMDLASSSAAAKRERDADSDSDMSDMSD